MGGTSGSGLQIGTRDWTVAAWVKTTGSGMVVDENGLDRRHQSGWLGHEHLRQGTLGAALQRGKAQRLN